MTSPHTAGRTESPRVADMMRRYAEARARLYGPMRSNIIRRPVEPPPPPSPPEPCKPVRRARDYIFIKPRAAGTRRTSSTHGGIWNTLAAEIIIRETAQEHGVTPSQIRGYGRSREVVAARYETFSRLQLELEYSLPMIGKTIGGRDHSGVLHGIRRHRAAERGEVYRMPRYGKALEVAAQ